MILGIIEFIAIVLSAVFLFRISETLVEIKNILKKDKE